MSTRSSAAAAPTSHHPYKTVASGEEKDELLLGKSSAYAGYPPMPTGHCLCCLTPASWNWLVRHATTLFWVSAMVGVLGGMTLSLGLTGRAFSRDCPDYAPSYYHGCLTNAEYFGVIVMVLFVPVGVLAFGAGIQMFSRRAHAPRCRPRVVLSLFALAFVIFSFVAIVMYTMVEPELTYQNKKIDYLLVFYGGFLVSVFTPIGAAVLTIAWNLARPKPSSALRPAGRTASEMGRMGQSKNSGLQPSNSFSPDAYPMEPLEPNTCAQNRGMLIFGFFVLLLAYWMTTVFTCIWNWYAGSYFAWTSPYSLWTLVVSDKFNFKFYKDTLVYYSFLMGVLLFGALAHFSPCLRRCTSKRIRVHSPTHRWYLPYTYGVSVGELILLAGVFALFGWWLYFWRYEYKRIETKAYKGEDPNWKPDANAELHIAARVTGHLTALAFAFLMLPVAKNSLWESALGIPFERALKYHRGMGVVMYLLCTTHMLFWWVKWFKEGIFWWNLTRVDFFRINPVDSHFDDFTVNLMTLLWAGCTVMIIIAIWWRRSNYNLFYITHLFSVIFLVGTIMHAWSFWYFAVGPCFLWFYDRMVRLKRASTQTTPMLALDYSPATGCTRVELPRETFQFHAGQYAYLQIAELSPLAWHPFTVSSAPSAPTRTFHIKAEAPGSWTYRLARLAETLQGRSELPVIAVDAAYGRSNYIHGHTTLLMIGGGIGITPFTSLFTELYTRFCVAERDSVPLEESLSKLRKVHLVFTARSEAMLTMFSSLVYSISKHNPRGIFQVDLHATGPAQSDLEAPMSPSEYDGEPAALVHTRSKIVRSRPNFETIARELDHVSPGRLTLAMACGPAAVVDRVSELSFAHSYDFHHEVFHF